MTESANARETKLRFTVDDRWTSDETGEITLSWTDGGRFTLSERSNYSSSTILSGVYTRSSDGFRLDIDNPLEESFLGASLSLTISASNQAGRIEEVDFINIVNWGESLLERIENFFGLGGLLNIPGFDVPWMDTPTPTPAPPPPLPAPGTPDPNLVGHELLGAWSFSSGMVTYFFWGSDFVVFDEDGIVMAEGELGFWSVDGNELTVIEDFGQGRTRYFYYEIVDGKLYITDSDDDTGEFERLW